MPYMISSTLLIQAILGGTFCRYAPLKQSGGYLFTDRHNIGRAFLEYCYSEIFNIRRYPGYENYYAKSSSDCRYFIEEGIIEEREIEEAERQLKELYEYTQEQLDGPLDLYRSLNRFEAESMTEADGHVNLIHSIMASYARDPNLYYNRSVKIHRKVPREDILMIDRYTSYSSCMCSNRIFTGESEVWVLNRDRFGMISIDYDDIVEGRKDSYPKKTADELNNCIRKNEDCNDKSLQESVSSSVFPCEYSRISRFIVRHNKRLIEALTKR